jgi:hypothetical protein
LPGLALQLLWALLVAVDDGWAGELSRVVGSRRGRCCRWPVHDGGMSGDPLGELVDDERRPLRRCIRRRRPVMLDGQPGDATCMACGARQNLTAPSPLCPTGEFGRYA